MTTRKGTTIFKAPEVCKIKENSITYQLDLEKVDVFAAAYVLFVIAFLKYPNRGARNFDDPDV